jgi:hypothetical protein
MAETRTKTEIRAEYNKLIAKKEKSTDPAEKVTLRRQIRALQREAGDYVPVDERTKAASTKQAVAKATGSKPKPAAKKAAAKPAAKRTAKA